MPRRDAASEIDTGLLIQLFLNRFTAGTRPERSPEPMGAFVARRAVACAAEPDIALIPAAGFNRIGDEDHRSIGHQDVSTAGVSAGYRGGS